MKELNPICTQVNGNFRRHLNDLLSKTVLSNIIAALTSHFDNFLEKWNYSFWEHLFHPLIFRLFLIEFNEPVDQSVALYLL